MEKAQFFFILLQIVIFLLPGVSLSKLVFPKEKNLWVFTFGIPISFILTGFGALLLSGFNRTISNSSIFYYNFILTLLITPFIFRKYKHFYSISNLNTISIRIKDNISSVFPIALVMIFLITVIILIPIAQDYNEKGFTEFFIVDGFKDNNLWTKPHDANEPITLNYAVTSHEKNRKHFSVILRTKDRYIYFEELGYLDPENTTTRNIVIPPRTENPQKFQLILLDTDNNITYRSLYFWIHSE